MKTGRVDWEGDLGWVGIHGSGGGVREMSSLSKEMTCLRLLVIQ